MGANPSLLTRHKISKANSCHGDETKVKPVKKRPVVLPGNEKERSDGNVKQQDRERGGGGDEGATQTSSLGHDGEAAG